MFNKKNLFCTTLYSYEYLELFLFLQHAVLCLWGVLFLSSSSSSSLFLTFTTFLGPIYSTAYTIRTVQWVGMYILSQWYPPLPPEENHGANAFSKIKTLLPDQTNQQSYYSHFFKFLLLYLGIIECNFTYLSHLEINFCMLYI